VLSDGNLQEERTFHGDSCNEVVGAAAVVVALLMQSPSLQPLDGAPSKTDETKDDTSAAPSSDSSAEQKTDAEHAQSDQAPSTSALIVSVPMVAGSFGLLPRATWGVGAGVGWERARFRLALSGLWFPTVSLTSSDFEDSGARVTRGSLTLSGCRWFGPGKLEFAPCLAADLERLRARGEGTLVSSRTARVTWLALGPALVGRMRVREPFALTAGTSLLIQTSRPVLVIDGQGELAQIGLLNWGVNLGAEWIF
jgi:hypothetical protein